MYQKYIRALELMDAMIACNQECTVLYQAALKKRGLTHPQYTYTEEESAILQRMADKWDDLYFFVLETFEPPKANFSNGRNLKEEFDLCRPFLDGTFPSPSKELEDMIRSIPPVILDAVWPVAIARFLLRDCRALFYHRMTKTFTTFHDRYGAIILGC